MEPWNKRFLQSVFLPGGAILLGAFLLLGPAAINPSVYGVKFFYFAVFLAALLLSWRFHTTRILLAAIVLLLANRALEFFAQAHIAPYGTGRVAFEAIALLLPLNFILLTFFPERGYQGRSLFWFLALLFFESDFVAAIARPDQPVLTLLHLSPVTSIHSRVPQPALLPVVVAIIALLVHQMRFQKPALLGMFSD